ncbi:hypothetical protein GBSOP10_109948 [Armatimonadetes bacterium GBS]|jgi:hypothetical protein|nr:hypothetical protein GBSOP10_109948 [Armatimonadetes bacterium GBS]CUU36552.1 hypothetical protein GXSOP10_12613 [Armatimonadetes bacterium GXS]
MRSVFCSLALAVSLALGCAQPFTYQGALRDGGNPANGTYDFEFRLFDAALGGSQIGATVTADNLPVQNGLFTVGLNFGAHDTIWTGAERYLEIAVRPGSSTGAYTTLSPRVRVTHAPYSFFALKAPWNGLLNVPAGFADNIDNDTTYSAGAGLQLSGTTFGIAPSGVVTGMLADGAVTDAKLSTTGVTAGAYGSATQVAQFTVNAQGRITAARNVAISGVPPGGAAGGDLAGTYPAPTVARIQGRPVSTTAPSNGQVLKWSGTEWAPANDADTQYSAGAGLSLSGTTFSVATGGIVTGMLANNAVNSAKLASDAASLNKVSGGLMNSTGARIGVGTTSPLAGFQVDAPEGEDVFRVRSQLSTGTTTRMIVLADGKTGIGLSGPAARLSVSTDTANEDILHLRSDGSTRVVVSHEGRVGIGVGSSLPSAQLIVDGAFGVDPFRVRTEDSAGVATTRMIVTADGNVGIGTTAPDEKLVVNGTAKVDVLQIVGADFAEKFPTTDEVQPGMVVEIDPDNPGNLRLARGAYNKRVAGIVAGANGLSKGIVLGNLEGSENHTPVAISGRVWVYADATQHAIEPGDLLTTAERAGYAMKATDLQKAQGAILGKAMTRLEQGKTGFVLVLVNLL